MWISALEATIGIINNEGLRFGLDFGLHLDLGLLFFGYLDILSNSASDYLFYQSSLLTSGSSDLQSVAFLKVTFLH